MVKLNKIYTRTGDDGSTGLVDGSRIGKDEALMAAIGDTDEANSAIGVAIAHLPDGTDRTMLLRIQNELFDLGADLATPVSEAPDPEWALRIIATQVDRLEQDIDRLNEALPPLDSFVLPGGSAAAGHVHVARAIVRRAERSAVGAQRSRPLNAHALAYLNRLSDLLFVLARALNAADGGDVKWVPGGSR